jgi:adenylylsulfate kinase-like enzyme
MITLIYGQPASGKTTLAKAIIEKLQLNQNIWNVIHIDGDEWRDIINNKVYDKEGRMRNLQSAFDLALNLEKQGFHIILSFVCPYEAMRSYLREKTKVAEIYLTCDVDRGRKQYNALDFEAPKPKVLELNTTYNTINACVRKSLALIKRKSITI